MNLDKTAVSKAILNMAGEKLQKTCTQYVENGMQLDHGQIVITPAYGKLRCKKIIHAHLPLKGSVAVSPTNHSLLIDKIVNDSLQKVENEKMKSISFPAFGLGRGGYTVEEIAAPMLKAFQAFGQSQSQYVKSIRVVIYDPDLCEEFKKAYFHFFGHSLSDPAPPLSLWQRLFGSNHKVNNESQELQKSESQAPHTAGWQSATNSTIIFTIFATSDNKCKDTATKLRQLVHDKSTTKTISDPYIEQLLEDDVAEIYQIRNKLGVQVDIFEQINEINISGEKSLVFEAQRDIEQVLGCVQKSEVNLQNFEWQGEEDDGTYEAFPPEANVRLERAYTKMLNTKMLNTIELTVEGIEVEIDLKNLTETNKTTRRERKIKRCKETMQGMSC